MIIPGLGLGARPVLRGLRPGRLRPSIVTNHFLYSTSSSGSIPTVPLVYDLHEPAKPVSDDPNRTSPILFLHGLFGSKKNNRSISKYVCSREGWRASSSVRSN